MKKNLFFLFLFSCFVSGLFAQVPTIDFTGSLTTICAGQSVSWSNLTTNANTYTWSFPGATSANTSNDVTPSQTTYIVPGTYTVSLAAENSNGSDIVTKADYITVLATPIVGITPSSGSICLSESITLVATGGNSYLWSPSGGLDNTSGSTVVAMPSIPTTYSVLGTSLNGCSAKSSVAITITNPPLTPGTITGSSTVCGNQSAIYNIASVVGALTYSWTVPAGATITSGQGTNTISVVFSAISGNVCVTANNSCGASPQKCLAISLTNIPTLGVINGPTTVCTNQTSVNYSTPNAGVGTTYTWSVPLDATINSGQGTRSISVSFGVGSGTICCTGSNICGSSTSSCKTITVDPNAVVGRVTNIYGPTTLCGNQSTQYTISVATGASSYNWTVPAGAIITAGQGTESITITYSVTSGNVCVTASNGCSTSPQKCLAITVNNIPPLPGAISGQTTVCSGQSNIVYTVPGFSGLAPTRTWTVPSGATITSGQGT
jgi:large repetitive protein